MKPGRPTTHLLTLYTQARRVVRDGTSVYVVPKLVVRYRLVRDGVTLAAAPELSELQKFQFPGASIEEIEENGKVQSDG